MKPILEHLPKAAGESFVVRDFHYSYYPTPWHFHPEYEIVLVTESTGNRFIGDNIAGFRPGDLAVLGPNLPHLYRNDAQYYIPSSPLKASSIVVHFLENSFGDNFLHLPEAKKIRQLLVKSERGIGITGKTNAIVCNKLVELVALKGLSRYLKLLEILQIISESKDTNLISGGKVTGGNEKESERMAKVLSFVIDHFEDDISVADAAKIANMAENSFTRFFRQRTRKTFMRYLNELRLNQVAKRLIESNKAISDICFECGFNNLSNFHRYFKSMYQVSPLQYRKSYWDNEK